MHSKALSLLAALILSLSLGLSAAERWEKALPPEQAIPTLETALQLLAEGALLAPEKLRAKASSLGLSLEEDMVLVVVKALPGLSASALVGMGAEVRYASRGQGLWEVALPPQRLLELAELPDVLYVRRPYRPCPAVVSEGVELTGAAAWHAQGNLGQGVRVAVIDLEFGGLAEAIAAGELTNVAFTRDYTGTGLERGGVHGTACAEIVQDMAPGAELVLMKIGTEVQLAAAVADALDLGVQVITHSVGWLNTNFYDGTGIICDIVQQATHQGVLWVNAAGNFAAGPHWEGDWQDPDGDGLLDFSPGDELNRFVLEDGDRFLAWLTWDDWPASDQDYDLFLIDLTTGEVVAASTGVQNGTQEPTEQIFFIPGRTGVYALAIQASQVTEFSRLELFCVPFSVDLEYSVSESSINAPGNAPFVFTVGAISREDWSTGPQEPFSSQGPTNASKYSPAITKPDICGPDGVSTLSYGSAASGMGEPIAASFYGTSAATPHLAGAAALVLAANPGWTGEQARQWLEEHAVDMGPLGKDDLYGFGRLSLAAAPIPQESSPLPGGWNLTSVPLAPADPDPDAVYGDDVAPLVIWQWDPGLGQYVVPGAIAPAEGYWLHVPAGGATVDVTGDEVADDVALVLAAAGWHQISAPWAYPRDAIAFEQGGDLETWDQAVAAGWIADVLWGYTPGVGYQLVNVLDPWQGYWLRTNVPNLIMHLVFADRLPAGMAVPETAPLAVPEGAPAPPPPPVPPEAGSGELVVGNFPNPVRDVNTTVFRVLGPMAAQVEEIRVRIFDLSGRLVWQGTAAGAELEWHTDDLAGQYLANGVYLYQVQVEVGGNWITTELKVLAILR